MRKLKMTLVLVVAVVVGSVAASTSQAQVAFYGGGGFVGPMFPRPYPVVTAYRGPYASHAYVAPIAGYGTYRPVVPVPVYRPAYRPVGIVPAPLVRPAAIGPGIGGYPNVYLRGQPVRNALRFAIP